MLLVLAAGIAALLAVLPLIRQAPDAVRRTVYPLRYEETIRDVSAEHGLEPTFVAAVVYREPLQAGCEVPPGAYGLMQLLPETARFIQERSGIEGRYRDPKVNLRMGAWYLSYLEDRWAMRGSCSRRIIQGKAGWTPGSPTKASTSARTSPTRRPTTTSRTS